jgi:hypothetical protein
MPVVETRVISAWMQGQKPIVWEVVECQLSRASRSAGLMFTPEIHSTGMAPVTSSGSMSGFRDI